MDKRKKSINCIINNIIFLYLILNEISFVNCEYNIIVFNSQEYRAGQFAFNSNGDMIKFFREFLQIRIHMTYETQRNLDYFMD